MKNLIIKIFLGGLCGSAVSVATAQTTQTAKHATNLATDSIVNVAYRTVQTRDVAGAISVLNTPHYLDKNYGTYPLEGADAMVGGSNLWGLGNALVLIDGEPRSLSDITTNEIAQITFLKGANAVVLYGTRAANGVIQITTKRGKAGVHGSSVRVHTGISEPKSLPHYLNSANYMSYYNQASINDGLPAMYADSTIRKYASHSNPYRYPDVDYFSSDYLRKFYSTYSANAEFTSGTERARFYALAGFQSQNSLLNFGEGKNERNTRLNLRGNIDLKLNSFISTYVNVSTVFSTNKRALGNYWQQAGVLQPQQFAPLLPISMVSQTSKDAQAAVNGSRNIIDGKYLLGGNQQYLTNPIADVYAAGYDNFTSRQFQYTNGIDVDLKNLLKGLSLHGQMTVDYSNTYDETLNNTYAVYAPTWNSFATGDSITALTKYNKDSKPGIQNLGNTWSDQLIDFDIHLDYINTFKDRHNVSAMLVADGLRRRQTGDFQYRTNANIGLQLSYNYNHKYYADFSGAVVNSTKLPAGKRVAFSPTANLGWLISEEGFLKNSSWIDRLKIGASAGVVNTDLDFNSYYMYDAVYSPTAFYSWSDGTYVSQATTISRGENLNLSYAKRKEVNFTVEGSFFKKKLNLMANLFAIRKDGVPVQSYSQYPSYFVTSFPVTSFVPYTNFQADNYHGADFQLDYHEKVGNVNITVGGALTIVKTKALKRDELYTDAYRNRAGKPVDAIFGLQNEGFFADQNDIDTHAAQKFAVVKPGDIKYRDQNGDGIIDERDEVYIGRWNGTVTGGLNITVQYKAFSLFVLGTGNFGGTGVKSGSYYWVSGAAKYSDVVRNSWTEANKNSADYPRLTTTSGSNNFRTSDFWTYSTNRFNLTKVQLTYTLPQSILKNSFVKGFKAYISANDLLMIAKNKAIMELNVGSVPQTRFYNFGIKGEF